MGKEMSKKPFKLSVNDVWLDEAAGRSYILEDIGAGVLKWKEGPTREAARTKHLKNSKLIRSDDG